jgi:ADP-ribose pyrophosphatase YjhB (NUDIX family)
MEYWKFIREKVGKEKVLFTASIGGIIKEDKILLVFDKGRKHWQLPGGLQELDESVEQTAIREISEELGVKGAIKELISIYSDPKWSFVYPNGDPLQIVDFLFLMEVNEEEFEKINIDENEITEYNWFYFSDLPETLHPKCRLMCKDLQEFKGKTFLR